MGLPRRLLAAVGGALLCIGWLTACESQAEEPDRGLTFAQLLACAQAAFEGDVVAVRAARPKDTVPMQTVSVDVTKWIKPAGGGERVEFLEFNPRWNDDPPFRKGQRLLVVMGDRRGEPAQTFRNSKGVSDLATGRDLIDRNLERSARTACPKWWRDRER
ncbi:hypothetical protein [Streptomyces boninensis]|uniref:hypothetical protein n=1 Tax=Streptomyces boninensis TaxID=2039455 RepID=UPI003B224F29